MTLSFASDFPEYTSRGNFRSYASRFIRSSPLGLFVGGLALWMVSEMALFSKAEEYARALRDIDPSGQRGESAYTTYLSGGRFPGVPYGGLPTNVRSRASQPESLWFPVNPNTVSSETKEQPPNPRYECYKTSEDVARLEFRKLIRRMGSA